MLSSTPPKATALFGIALFMLGASTATTSFVGVIAAFSMLPAMFVFEATSLTDIVVSIMAIAAAKNYGPKSLISSTVLSGLNTVLRAVAVTMVVFYVASGTRSSVTPASATSMPNEDDTRLQYNLPSDEFPSFAPGSDRPPRPHGPGGPGQRPPHPRGPGGPGECPPLPADLPPFPGPGELPPFPGDVPPFPGGPGRPGHCGPGFPGGPGRPGHPGGPHEVQDPRDGGEQQPGQGREQEHSRGEHDGPRRGREEQDRDDDQSDQHEGPRRGREEDTDREGETDPQRVNEQRARGRPSPTYVEQVTPYFALALAVWAFGLNVAIFVLSIVHTRRVLTQNKSAIPVTTTVNGKVYSELRSKV